MEHHHSHHQSSLLVCVWRSRLYILLLACVLFSLGLSFILPALPNLATNYFASRHAGETLECEDYSFEEQPRSCQLAHSDVVRWSSPNGSVDQVAENDTWTISFNASLPVALVNLILTLDNYGSDVTWELATDVGTVLYEDGPYPDFQNGVVDSVAFCLTNGCYTFTINDFFGNGLCCDDGEGSYVIRDAFGVVHAESDGLYTDQNVNEFCLEGVSVPEATMPAITISPNPSQGLFQIMGLSGTGGSYSVLDAVGRTVLTGRIAANRNQWIDLTGHPAGIYNVVAESVRGRAVERLVLAH